MTKSTREIHLLLIALIFSSCGTAQNKHQNNAAGEWVVKDSSISKNYYSNSGLLDSVHTQSFSILAGNMQVTTTSCTKNTYDDKHNLVQSREYELTGSKLQLTSEKDYQYDKNNQLVVADEKELVLLRKIIYERNSSGKLLKMIDMWDENPSGNPFASSIIPHYDTTTTTYAYNSDSVELSYSNYDSRGRLLSTTFLQYAGGKQVADRTVDTSGDTTITRTYSEAAGITTEITNNRRDQIIDTTWTKNDQTIKTLTVDKPNKLQTLLRFTYDDKGNELLSVGYEKKG